MENKANKKIDTFGTLAAADVLFTKVANNQFTTHRYSKEWKTAIIGALLLDFIATVLSVYSGYFYLSILLTQMLENKLLAQISTVFILVVLEFLVHFSLAKFFKFAIKFVATVSITILFFLGFLYTISFYMSTQGLSINESKKVDKSELINENKNVEIENLKNQSASEIEYFKNEIATQKANPQGWTNGKRAILTKEQLITIKEYNNRINEIKQTLRTDINNLEKQAQTDKKNNMVEVTSTAQNYYSFISILMLVELIASGFLMFSWSQIQSENEPEKHIKSKVIDISAQYKSLLNNFLMSELNTIKNGFALALNEHEIETVPFEIETIKNENTNYKNSERKVGFQIVDKGNANVNSEHTENKKCEHCGADISDKKHWNAKFCSYECRKEHWELKTGVKFKLKKPKKQ